MAIRKQTGSYWEKRSLERLTEIERASLKHLEQIGNIYEEAQRRTVRSVQEMYAAYYKGKEGWDMAALKSIAPTGDIHRFLEDMKAHGLDTFLPDNYQGRMTRLELLNAQMWGESKKLALKETDIETAAHTETIDQAYYRTIYNVSKGIGSTPSFNVLNTDTVNGILNAKFMGKNFSQRVWSNTNKLAAGLKSTLATAVATGQAPAKTVREIRDKYGVKRFEAERLIRTETNHFENVASVAAYEEIGIDKYVFMATLDGRTSAICRKHDGKIYEVGTGELPPLHPFCRSTTRPYIGKEYEPETRIARDTDGKNEYVTNMSYNDWRDLFVHDVASVVGEKDVLDTKNGIVTTSYGAKYDSQSMWGMSSQAIADTVDQARYMLDLYPQVQSWVKKSRQKGLVVRAGRFSDRGTLATTVRLKPVITMSRPHFRDYGKAIAAIEKGIKKGHFMPATRPKYYVFNHEFGHLVENYLLRDGNYNYRAAKVANDIIDIAKSKYNLNDTDIDGMISKYGKENSREFFGETFANLHSGKPNKLARAMSDYLKENL